MFFAENFEQLFNGYFPQNEITTICYTEALRLQSGRELLTSMMCRTLHSTCWPLTVHHHSLSLPLWKILHHSIHFFLNLSTMAR